MRWRAPRRSIWGGGRSARRCIGDAAGSAAPTAKACGRKRSPTSDSQGAKIFKRLMEEIHHVLECDPAARSRLQVALCYAGFYAICLHRLVHRCWHHRLFLAAHLVSSMARFVTGIEIHAAATIGRRVFIDHCIGVVIGEIAEIGDDCTIYQGVTLGGFTVGDGARIASNAVVLVAVVPHATVAGIPSKVMVSLAGAHVPLDATVLAAVVLDKLERQEQRMGERLPRNDRYPRPC